MYRVRFPQALHVGVGAGQAKDMNQPESFQRNRRFRSVLEEHEVITRHVTRTTYYCLDSE